MTHTRVRSIRKGRSLPAVKADNLVVVLEALQKLQPVSRTSLADVTGLTPATITHMIDELASFDLLRESPSGERQVGRRPTLLTFNPSRGHVIGVEVSRSGMRSVRVDFAGRAVQYASRAFKPTASVRRGVNLLRDVIEEVRDSSLPLLGIGVGVPGPIDTTAGVVLGPPNFAGWRNVPLGAMVTEAFGVPCWVEDDAKAAAFGERWHGAGRTAETLLYISLRSGIGAGLIVGDRVYRGTHELAGEIGHTTIHVDGPMCECGNRGCVETLVSAPALLQEARRLGVAADTVDQIHELAQRGDAVAQNIKERAYTYLGAAVLNAVNHYDPELIVLGGGLVRAWPDLVPCVAARVKGRSFGYLSKDVHIVPSALAEDATALGAAALAAHGILRRPRELLSVRVPGPAAAPAAAQGG